MKRGYSKLLYNQRNKDETIISVIKRLFGEHVTSRLVRTQNRELSFRCIPYNMHRLTNLIVVLMVSTKPDGDIVSNTATAEETTKIDLVDLLLPFLLPPIWPPT